MRDLSKLLWCDLKNDEERIEFLKSGRACDTGIIAQSLVSDIVELLKYRNENQDIKDCLSNNKNAKMFVVEDDIRIGLVIMYVNDFAPTLLSKATVESFKDSILTVSVSGSDYDIAKLKGNIHVFKHFFKLFFN